MKHGTRTAKPSPTMDEFRSMAIAALTTPAPAVSRDEIVAVLQKACQFIENGVEDGYIRLPDADTPDPAHETLPAIHAILSRIRGEGE